LEGCCKVRTATAPMKVWYEGILIPHWTAPPPAVEIEGQCLAVSSAESAVAKDELTSGEERLDIPADGEKTGIHSLPLELFDPISDLAIRSAITKDPAQTARSIADYKAVSRAFGNSVERNSEGKSAARTQTRQFIKRLGRLGAMAKQVHGMAFPKEGLTSTDFDMPGSGSTRIHAAGELIAFQSETRKARLVQDILDIESPAERMNAIAGLIHVSATGEPVSRVVESGFAQLGPKHQKPLIDEVFRAHLEEPRVDRLFIGERPTADMIVAMEKQLQLEHLQRLGAMLLTDPDKLREIVDAKASSIENTLSIPPEEPIYGPKQQIDRRIDHLEERVELLKPTKDLGHIDPDDPANQGVLRKNWNRIHEMASLSKEISSTYHEAREEMSPRKEIAYQERSRETGGR